ncbi:DNA-binding protein [Mesorhizobium sp. M4A.F.Ca.ET.020.02.1.1]|uniref:DNA-binding protein n=1 Tax=unclassified Mesorhizobium TaxID=325217 RepID=UPI000FD51FB1|nr:MULTISPECIES: DNA-binding protein [unclassified Mesorhizobium]RVD35609.1 DNA-binding protein [Mesorhizobium sp. M4A.F.Ca.ET.020.02.1.1]RWC20315.1 MAG: DNA-binding protein [Mesorhizobium sp.]TIX54362.1 MAG: DNA-binding protein [Mesorhizobium sp.]
MEDHKPRPLWGAKAIGEEIGLTERQTYHKLEKGLLPAKKIGDQWVADARQLHALISGEAA